MDRSRECVRLGVGKVDVTIEMSTGVSDMCGDGDGDGKGGKGGGKDVIHRCTLSALSVRRGKTSIRSSWGKNSRNLWTYECSEF